MLYVAALCLHYEAALPPDSGNCTALMPCTLSFLMANMRCLMILSIKNMKWRAHRGVVYQHIDAADGVVSAADRFQVLRFEFGCLCCCGGLCLYLIPPGSLIRLQAVHLRVTNQHPAIPCVCLAANSFLLTHGCSGVIYTGLGRSCKLHCNHRVRGNK